MRREDRLRGRSIPISAITKGSRAMGRQIEGLDEGWVDMEKFADGDDSDGPRSRSDDEEDEEDGDDDSKGKGKGGGGGRRRT